MTKNTTLQGRARVQIYIYVLYVCVASSVGVTPHYDIYMICIHKDKQVYRAPLSQALTLTTQIPIPTLTHSF